MDLKLREHLQLKMLLILCHYSSLTDVKTTLTLKLHLLGTLLGLIPTEHHLNAASCLSIAVLTMSIPL